MDTPRKKTIISLPRDLVRQLADQFTCNEGTIYSALAFRSDSAKAKLIRDNAISLGGLITEKLV